MSKLIGITGYAQHGKDTTGNYLVEQYGFTRYAFADQLKSMALVLNPYVDDTYSRRLYTLVQSAGWDEAKENPEIRRFLQVLGTEAVRDHLGEDAWVNALQKRAQDDGLWDRQGPGHKSQIVVTDVRFPNEAQFIKKHGGELWRVKRIVKKDFAMTEDFDNGLGTEHPSEKFIASLKADKTLIARGVDDLYLEIDDIMRRSA